MRLSAGIVALGIAWGSGAAAEEAKDPRPLESLDATVVVVARLSSGWSVADLVERLRVELGRRVDTEPSSGAIEVEVAEEGSAAVSIAVAGRGTSERIELGDLPPAERPRALALAIAELFRRPPMALQTPTPAPPRAVIPRAPSSPSIELALSASGALRSYAAPATFVPSAEVGAALAFARSRRFEAELAVGYGSATFTDPLGDVGLDVYSAGAGLLVNLVVGSVRVGVGPRAELSLARVRGASSGAASSRAFDAPLFTATAAAKITWRAASWIGPFLRPEVGVTSGGFEVRADDRVKATVGGPVALLHAGVTLFP